MKYKRSASKSSKTSAIKPRRSPSNEDAKIGAMLDAVNKSSELVRGVFLFFMLISLYIAILVGSTTHKQLFLASDIPLPFMQISLPIVDIYCVTPWIYCFLHFNLLQLLLLHSEKLNALRTQSGSVVWEKNKNLLYPIFFSNWHAMTHQNKFVHWTFVMFVYCTMVLTPLAILLFIQIRFLPYHSETITWLAHRIPVISDSILLWMFWRRIRKREFFSSRIRNIAVFSTSFLLSMSIFIFSMFFATIPRESFLKAMCGEPSRSINFNNLIDPDRLHGYCNRLRSNGYYHALEKFMDKSFPRNLNVDYEVLVKSPPSEMILAAFIQQGKSVEEAWIKHSVGANLQGRNYNNASISGARLYGAQLQHAELQGADLSWAELHNGKLYQAKMQSAYLSQAIMQSADLSWAKMQSADLSWAELQGAHLFKAQLEGADLSGAKLHGAYLTMAELRNAIFFLAQLEGADLSGAKLQGANLSGALLQGANLTEATLQGANLSGALLQGANLSLARFFQSKIDYSLLDWSDWNSAKVDPPDIKKGDKGPFTGPIPIEALTHVRHDGIFGKGNNPALFDEKQAQWIVENVFCKEFYTRSSILERSSDHLLQKIFEAMDHDPSCKEIPSDVPEISKNKYIERLEESKIRMKGLGSVRSQPGRK
ncbi:MAG: pentapeptide repeat-containing protein [Magnetococcales bacterium]|nr:pentapeptide repeat-containing protein [Magnetococcales bacterium]